LVSASGLLLAPDQALGDHPHIEAPAGSVTPELRQALAGHKADLLTLHAIRARLHAIAARLGIPRAVVDAVPLEELEATAMQASLCEVCMDGNGDPLTHALLVFYLKALTERHVRPASNR
jgi:hypothetical protein